MKETTMPGQPHPLLADFQRADDDWHQSLVRAFGPLASARRNDADQSRHPISCRMMYAKRELALAAWERGHRPIVQEAA